MSDDLRLAIQAAKQAGEIIRRNYGKVQLVTQKARHELVTETDKKAELLIITKLKQTGYSVYGEETGNIHTKSSKKWIIDPLDGTSNFIRGFSFFAVSIALIEDNKNLVLGVIYDPITRSCYFAEKNYGAYLNDKKIHISKQSNFSSSVILMDHGNSKRSNRDFLLALTKVTNNGAPVLRLGATALPLCYISKGAFEAFLSCGDKLYDYAAGLI
ncbi:MAG: inositol monophosphatase family protein, partial [bacterium]|nr:inositol monophosphatase family protein [bacterium]